MKLIYNQGSTRGLILAAILLCYFANTGSSKCKNKVLGDCHSYVKLVKMIVYQADKGLCEEPSFNFCGM